MMSKKWVAGAIAAAVAAAGWYGISRQDARPASQAGKAKAPPTVLVATAQQGSVPVEIEATGQVAPLQLVDGLRLRLLLG